MSHPRISSHEIVQRGKKLYDDKIKSDVEQGNVGRFLVVDVESGDYEIDDEDVKASLRLLDRHPGAPIYGLRIGFPVAYRFGGPLRPVK